MKKKSFEYRGAKYNPQSESFIEAGGCADITFINQGTADVVIGGTLVKAGQSFTDPAFGDEINESRYTVQSVTAGTTEIYFRKKIYK